MASDFIDFLNSSHRMNKVPGTVSVPIFKLAFSKSSLHDNYA